MDKKRAKKITKRVLLTLILTPIILIGVMLILLYMPVTQRFIFNEVCEICAKEIGCTIKAESFSLEMPLALKIKGATIEKDGRNVMQAEQIGVDISLRPLLTGNVEVNYITIDNTTLDTRDLIEDMVIDGNISHFRVAARDIELSNEYADVRQLYLYDSNINVTIYEPEEEDTTENNWAFRLRNVRLENSSISINMPDDSIAMDLSCEKARLNDVYADISDEVYSIENIYIQNGDIGYGSMPRNMASGNSDFFGITSLYTHCSSIKYTPTNCKATINNLSAALPQGLEITHGKAEVNYNLKEINIKALSLATANGSKIDATVNMSSAFFLDVPNTSIEAAIDAKFNKRDLQGFIPQEQYDSLSVIPEETMAFAMEIKGTPKQIAINKLTADVPTIATLNARGEIKNILDIEEIDAYLTFDATATNIQGVIDRSATFASEPIVLSGDVTYNSGNATLNIEANSPNCNLTTQAGYNINNDSYFADIKIDSLSTAAILPQLPLHSLKMQAKAKGIGFDIFSQATKYDIDIKLDEFIYDSLDIRNIALTARQEKQLLNLDISADDPKIKIHTTATTRLTPEKINANIAAELGKLNLHALHLSKDATTISTNLNISASTDMRETHSLELSSKDMKIEYNGQLFTPANLSFDLSTSPKSSFVKLNTGDLIVDGNMDGGYTGLLKSFERLGEMLTTASKSTRTQYTIPEYEKELPSLDLYLNCGRSNILANLMQSNGIEFDKLQCNLKLDSLKQLQASAYLYNTQTTLMEIDTIRASIRQTDDVINYFAGVKTTSLDPEQEDLTFYVAMHGNIKGDNIKTNLVFRDSRDRTALRLGLLTTLSPKQLEFKLDPDAVVLDSKLNINPDNYFTLDHNMAANGNIEISDSAGASVYIYTVSDSLQLRDISMEISNINLEPLTSVIPFVPKMKGMLNANMHYSGGEKGTLFSGDLYCNDLVYEDVPIGNEIVEFVYLPKPNDEHAIDLTVYHNEHETMNIRGEYRNDSIKPYIDAALTLDKMPLDFSHAFTGSSDFTMQGAINGNMTLKGDVSNPKANGFVHFDNAVLDAPLFGTRFNLQNDTIKVVNNKLNLDNILLYAKGNTPIHIHGYIDFNNLANPELSLRMMANNYELINAKRTNKSIIYGRMFLDMNLAVLGSFNSMEVKGTTTVLGKTNVTYVMQESPFSTEYQLDGLVDFVNFQDTATIEQPQQEIDLGNMSVNIKLNIEEAARINADLDAARNNYVELQGGASLNFSHSTTSGTSLTGRYTLDDGEMKITLPIIPLKTFYVGEGSSINWTGDIFNPILDITALEKVTSSVEISDGDTQPVEFNVGVKVTNTLDDMDIDFTMSAPENDVVQDQLNYLDKATLSKYAITMLVSGVYMGDGSDISVSSALSSFVDAKINEFAGRKMKGVDLNVGFTDVENAETGGSYQNYSFSFAKRFWNDRLTIIIGGEVNTGDAPDGNNSFINNVSFEWKINNAGNRYLRLFYDKNYQSILEGEIIETGIGYVYKRKLNNLKELFIFRNKKKTLNIQNEMWKNLINKDKFKENMRKEDKEATTNDDDKL